MLKASVARLEDIEESTRSFYKSSSSGEGFVLDLDGTPQGFVAKTEHADIVNRLSTFRNNNIDLNNELEELRPLKSQYEGIDPHAARVALSQVEELSKKGVKKPDDVQTQISAALNDFTSKVVEPLKAQLEASEQARQGAELEAERGLMRSKVGEEFIGMGGKPGAMDFILGKAENVFGVIDGKVSAKENQFSTNSPGEPITPKEWLAQQVTSNDADFAFSSSNGGGASPKQSDRNNIQAQRLVNPTPSQLGENMDAITSGKIIVEHSGE
tara:strand:- start:299 stop:1108 length:810 start_codon:yes stop_codon:yes gene_type:complete